MKYNLRKSVPIISNLCPHSLFKKKMHITRGKTRLYDKSILSLLLGASFDKLWPFDGFIAKYIYRYVEVQCISKLLAINEMNMKLNG